MERRTYLRFRFIYKNVKIAIGTDSLRKKRKIKYATAIALFYSSESGDFDKGAHVIYTTSIINKKLDLWTRLWKEVEESKLVADYIKEQTNHKNLEIHIDINPDVQWESNKLLAAAVGYLTSLGYITLVKPNSWVASSCADHLVN